MSIKNQHKQYYHGGIESDHSEEDTQGPDLTPEQLNNLNNFYKQDSKNIDHAGLIANSRKLHSSNAANEIREIADNMTPAEIEAELARLQGDIQVESSEDIDFFHESPRDATSEDKLKKARENTQKAKMQKGGNGPALPENPFPIIGGKVLYNSKNNKSNIIPFSRSK